MKPRRRAWPAALITAMATTVAAAGCGQGVLSPPPHGGAAATARVGGPGKEPAALSRVAVPRHGAYLGGYVQPPGTSSGSQIRAVLSLQRRLGHPLGLVHVYHPWWSAFPNAADTYFARHGKVLLLTWGGAPTSQQIIDGRYNAMIHARAVAVKQLNRPILLEWRHEMDRPDLRAAIGSPADYIAAWKHIRHIFSAVGADNVSWVWCPTAWGFATGRAQAFYPGNSQVDWVCADAYATSPVQPLGDVLASFLSWAAHHPRPVLIGEFGARTDPAGWASWLAGVGRLAKSDPQIKALAYFNADGMSSRGLPYRFSLSHSTPALREFAALLAQPYFQPSLPAGAGG